MTKIQLFCSMCARNDYYIERIERAADKVGLPCTIERIEDETAWKSRNYEQACLFAYCPGCKVMHDNPDVINLPVVEINGVRRFDGLPATDQQLEECLKEYV